MLTTKTVHKKLQEISEKYKSGHPPISIKGVALELEIGYIDLLAHLNTLIMLKLARFDEYGEQIILTELGIIYDSEMLESEN